MGLDGKWERVGRAKEVSETRVSMEKEDDYLDSRERKRSNIFPG